MHKPMLAASYDEPAIRRHLEKEGPLLASPKLDGIRALTFDGKLYSRSLKPIPSLFLQERYKGLEHLDGELIAGLPNAENVYNQTFSGCMKIEGSPCGNDGNPVDVTYWVFDHTQNSNDPFVDRYRKLDSDLSRNIRVVPQKMVKTWEDVIELETDMLQQGYEGLMLRSPKGLYKHGRSTHKEFYLVKVKRDTDDVAEILDIYPAMHNTNEAFTNELGHTDRSTDASGLVETDRAGGFKLLYKDMIFNCAMGKFTHEEAKDILKNKNRYIGNYLLEFTFFGYGNIKDGKPGAPRHPRGKKFRSKLDS